ncbi:hypothetical protein [Pseudomonas phage PPpW-3]|uniref:Uncharacterized protein n=1 Tax=Pseudomonas phage PPpW-3 TaxID=1279082 RepID=V5YUS8_9CAUD|nr:hypothetical protein X916_gp61 [Pseudomonas phage PPpW-3]BAO20661.1 hypothetical protein [Pseudomonas phage PPpW-3]
MDNLYLTSRTEAVRQAIASNSGELRGRMTARQVMQAIGMSFAHGDKAAIGAALTAEGMARCITHESGVFIFNPA